MSKSGKKAIIVGAGIVGLASAYRLAEAGYEVHVIEQNSHPGEGTSKGNAGQLLYDRIGVMGSPGFLKKIPGTLLDVDQGIEAMGLLRPANWHWLAAFIGQCTSKAWQDNTKKLIEIAHLSREAMSKFTNVHDVDFKWRKSGKIIIQQDQAGLESARRTAEFQARFGGRHQMITAEECLEREPALQGGRRKIAGGLYMPDAEVGDSHVFCQILSQLITEQFGGKISFDTRVMGFEKQNGKIQALHTNEGLLECDLFVVATGGDVSTLLPQKFDGRKPVTGVKGISLTYPGGERPPDMSVTDATGKFVVMRMGDKIRVAGYAIFSSNLEINPDHVAQLSKKARSLMPEAADFDSQPEIWAGLRPQTPDGLPMIGHAGAENLYVNTGHGSMGWLLAFGSAEILLQKIKGETD